MGLWVLVAGAANLDGPSLWHDELVHVFVAKGLVATGIPSLPSGHVYTSGTTFNFILAGFVYAFSDGETAVRMPSVIITIAGLPILYFVLRTLIGRLPAVIAIILFATSPWTIAWAREARFYALQQLFFVLTMGAAWQYAKPGAAHPMRWFAAFTIAYVAGLATAFHSIIFLGPIMVFLTVQAWWYRAQRKRYITLLCAAIGLAIATFVGYYIALPEADHDAIFAMGAAAGVGDESIQRLRIRIREDKLFYGQWLMRNHSAGFLILALFGTIIAPLYRGRKGLFVALAFWAPFIVLSFLIDYRRPRFIYFAFPFYIALTSIGASALIAYVLRCRESWWRGVTSVIVMMFLIRLCVSVVSLTGDSIETASGADITLARRHPQWRDAAAHVREAMSPEDAIISTTYLPALYYVGRCDETFPTRLIPWEYIESGSKGIADVEALEAFVADHPRGYFLADWQRFGKWARLAPEKAWVRDHMKAVPKASNDDITVYRWSIAPENDR